MVKTGWFPIRSEAKQGYLLLPIPVNIVLEVVARIIRQEKEIKVIHIRKEEVKPILFTDNMTLYIENLKESTEKLLELINKFHDVTGCKINIQKSVFYNFWAGWI